ncbi:MAG: AraC family transcriptional regulator [bacterium]|nr:AraC family transcriptional regulator [bacterium]
MYFTRLLIDDIIIFCEKQNVNPTVFKSYLKKIDESGNVSFQVMDEILCKAIEKSNNDAFGLHLAEYNLLKATESVDSIMGASMDINEAFQNAVEYSKLISNSMNCEMNDVGSNQFSVIFNFHPEWILCSSLARRHNLETALVSAVKSLQALTGFKYFPVLVRLPHSRTNYLSEYYRIFNCNIEFNQSKAEIIFDLTLLNKPVQTADFGLLQILKLNAQKEIEESISHDQITDKVKKLILEYLSVQMPIDHTLIADQLETSSRTLQRRLKENGTSFKSLYNELKLRLALRHLLDDQLSIEATAYLVGYSEPSALIRAFKKWKGVTPKQYLKQAMS